MKKILILSMCIILLVVLGVNAQEQEKTFVKFESVSFSIGWYKPQMDYWNNEFCLEEKISEKFKGNMLVGGRLSFKLPVDLYLDTEFNYWSETIEGNDESSIRSLRIAFSRLKALLKFKPKSLMFNDAGFYIGLSGNILLISNKVSGWVEDSQQNGQDFYFSPSLGFEKKWKKVKAGIEYSYILGSYKQEVIEGNETTEKKVSINGSEVLLSVGYCF